MVVALRRRRGEVEDRGPITRCKGRLGFRLKLDGGGCMREADRPGEL